ncbi:hypothetical protein [Roseiterribacter gracilis]|uniref:hypothetical protein n=1 Tax=Roseiterribacter gracilis TaxID=2812848 RepID=UPI003B428A56
MAGGSARSRADTPDTPARTCSARELRLISCNDNRRPDSPLRRRIAWIVALLFASAAASIASMLFLG